MNKFLKAHQEQILIFLAIFFLGCVVGYYVWGIAGLTATFTDALTPPELDTQFIKFDLEGARALNIVRESVPESVTPELTEPPRTASTTETKNTGTSTVGPTSLPPR